MRSPDLPELAHRLRIEIIPYIVSMLSDDEALEGVEAWLNHQKLEINMGSHDPGLEVDMLVESSAGWLLRLVRHAREALAGDDASPSRCDLAQEFSSRVSKSSQRRRQMSILGTNDRERD